MIENELPAVPACNSGKYCGEHRQKQAVGQHIFSIGEPYAPVQADQSHKHHGRDSMGPACNPHADARYKQQFRRADKTCNNTSDKSTTHRPKPGAQPEIISRPPIDKIAAQRADHERNGKMNRHRMKRMPRNRYGRSDILLRDFFNNRAGAVARFVHDKASFFKPSIMTAKGFRLAAVQLLFLTGCTGDLSALDPAGPRADAIAILWWIMLIGAAVIFVMTTIALALAVMPSTRKHLSPRFLVIWAGLIIPGGILAALVIAAFTLGETLRTHASAPARAEVHVMAHQWGWEFRHGDTDQITRDIAYIPAGHDIDFLVTSRDVVHSFWVPRLGGKIDAIPGHVNRIRLHANAEGTYRGVCAEFCGTGHAVMQFTVIAVSEAEYTRTLSKAAGDTP